MQRREVACMTRRGVYTDTICRTREEGYRIIYKQTHVVVWFAETLRTRRGMRARPKWELCTHTNRHNLTTHEEKKQQMTKETDSVTLCLCYNNPEDFNSALFFSYVQNCMRSEIPTGTSKWVPRVRPSERRTIGELVNTIPSISSGSVMIALSYRQLNQWGSIRPNEVALQGEVAYVSPLWGIRPA